MDLFLRAAAAVLLTVVLSLALGKQGKETAGLLSIIVCCMVISIAIRYLEPVWELLEKLGAMGDLDNEMVGTLFKVVGIGILAEIAALVCNDAGNASLGKTLQLLSSAVILWLCIPIFIALLDLIQGILGGI